MKDIQPEGFVYFGDFFVLFCFSGFVYLGTGFSQSLGPVTRYFS